ncbi:MAG: ABC transporter substrate-binding protein [Dehalococcoidia bacterium]
MTRQWFRSPKALILIPVLLVLLVAVACGSAAPVDIPSSDPPAVKEQPAVKKDAPKDQPAAAKEKPKDAARAPVAKAEPTAVPAMAMKPEGTLNVGQKELSVFIGSPRLAGNPQIFVQGTAPIGESLLTVDKNLTAVGMLAESWEVSADALTWTFNLHRGVQFHKGYGEMTAEDVIFSMNEFGASAKHPRASNIRGVWENPEGSVKATDPYTLAVNTGKPWSEVPVWEMLTSPAGSATWIVSKKQSEELGIEEASGQIAATGPWDLVEFKTAEFWRMEAVEDHWRKTPHFAEMVFWEIPEESSRIAGFQTGTLDTTLIAFDSIPIIEAVEGAQLMSFPGGGESALTFYGQYYVGIGTPDQQPGYDPDLPWVSANPDLDSPEWERARKVRVALSTAIDRQAIVDTLLGGRGGPAVLWDFGQYEDTWLPPDMRWKFDPELSKRLLSEAGYPDGFSITLTPSLRGAPVEVEACEVIAQMWEDIGIDVKFQKIPYSTLRPSLIGRNYQGSTCHAGSIRLEPGQGFSGMLSKLNHQAVWNRGVEHPWLDEKVSKHMATVNAAERRVLGLEIARFMFDNALTGVGLYNFDVVWPVGPNIEPWLEGVRYRDLRNINGYEYIRPRQK